MSKVSINLLPPELENKKKAKAKKSLLTAVSVGFLAVVISIAIIVLGVRLVQDQDLKKYTTLIQSDVDTLNSKAYKDKEQLAYALRSRVDSVNSIINTDPPASYGYGMVTKLIPTDLKLDTFSIDKKGKMTIDASTKDVGVLDTFLNNLATPSQSDNKITKVNIEGVTRGKTEDMKIEITTTLPGGTK